MMYVQMWDLCHELVLISSGSWAYYMGTRESELRSLVLSHCSCRCRSAALLCTTCCARDILELIGLGKFGANDGYVTSQQ